MKKILSTHIANLWYYGTRTLVVLAIGWFAWHQNWVDAISSALILALMLTPMVLKRWCDLYLPFELEVGITSFIFVTLFLGSLNDFYERVPWWDMVLHFQSGVLLATLGFVLIYILNEAHAGKLALTPFFIAFFAACFSIATGVVWEIYEFAADSLFGFNMQRTGLPDTMKDLILNTIGALIVGIVGYIWMRWRLKVPFTPRRLAGSRYDRPKKD